MRLAYLAVIPAIAATLTPASACYINPTPEADFDNLIIVRQARDICPGVQISLSGTDDQIQDTGHMLGFTAEHLSAEKTKRIKAANDSYKKDAVGFCDSARSLLKSYDPAYLRKVGVTLD